MRKLVVTAAKRGTIRRVVGGNECYEIETCREARHVCILEQARIFHPFFHVNLAVLCGVPTVGKDGLRINLDLEQWEAAGILMSVGSRYLHACAVYTQLIHPMKTHRTGLKSDNTGAGARSQTSTRPPARNCRHLVMLVVIVVMSIFYPRLSLPAAVLSFPLVTVSFHHARSHVCPLSRESTAAGEYRQH
jgi:hypothetical protein